MLPRVTEFIPHNYSAMKPTPKSLRRMKSIPSTNMNINNRRRRSIPSNRSSPNNLILKVVSMKYLSKKKIPKCEEETTVDSSIMEIKRSTNRQNFFKYNFKSEFRKNYISSTKRICGKCDIEFFKEGILNKKTNGLLSGWKRKRCKIYNDQFLIYKNYDTGLLSGIIDFTLFPVTIIKDANLLTFRYLCKQNRITMIKKKSFTFMAENYKDFLDWTNIIEPVINKNKGKVWKTLFQKIEKFWKFRIMTANELLIKATTGDILLFSTKRVLSTVQRTITGSRFGKFHNNRRPCCFDT